MAVEKELAAIQKALRPRHIFADDRDRNRSPDRDAPVTADEGESDMYGWEWWDFSLVQVLGLCVTGRNINIVHSM